MSKLPEKKNSCITFLHRLCHIRKSAQKQYLQNVFKTIIKMSRSASQNKTCCLLRKNQYFLKLVNKLGNNFT